MASEKPIVTGVFPDRDSAERAYQSAVERGYKPEEVDLVMSEETRKHHFGEGELRTELGTKAAEGAGVGGAIGGAVGAIAAALAAVGTSVAIPGLGLVVAGPIATALAGAGAGAAAGGLIGALVGWNIPEEEVKRYESEIKKGGILMGVRPRTRDDEAHFTSTWRTNPAIGTKTDPGG